MSDVLPSPLPSPPVAGLSLWQRLIGRLANRLHCGRLTLDLPGRAPLVLRGERTGPEAVMTIHHPRLLWHVLTGGSLGFARAYLAGAWDSPDISRVLELVLANEAAFRRLMTPLKPVAGLARLRHRRRHNSRAGSRRNIAFHYDLGNQFYRQWLDPSMTYSSALFTRADQSLTAAQEAKYARIVDQLKIGPGDRVLEIGCGWGGFAEYAIRRTGCHVTGLTLSQEQARYAQERLAAAGLSDRFEVRLQDYRDCTGTFDQIVSIEMFEAVGEEHWPTYFDCLRRLAPQGQTMLQVITIDERYFDRYRRQADYIQAYIFPGGMLPSVSALAQQAKASGLSAGPVFRFGRDYERTLLAWDDRFTAQWPEIAPLGFDQRFARMWRYYLHYCAAGFRTGRIDVIQLHLTPAG